MADWRSRNRAGDPLVHRSLRDGRGPRPQQEKTSPMSASPRRGQLGAVALGLVLVLIAASAALFGGRGDEAATTSSLTGGGTQTIAVQLANMRITPSVVKVAAGTHLILEVTGADTVNHDLLIDGGPQTPMLSHGRSTHLDLGIVNRTVAGWCTVPGHKAAGMTMTIEVAGTDRKSTRLNSSHANISYA